QLRGRTPADPSQPGGGPRWRLLPSEPGARHLPWIRRRLQVDDLLTEVAHLREQLVVEMVRRSEHLLTKTLRRVDDVLEVEQAHLLLVRSEERRAGNER